MTDLKINTYPLHIGDWHSGTSRMSLAERGAYITLCNQYYLDQGNGWTETECMRLCGAMSREEQKAVKTVLASKFEQIANGYRHAGMDDRIADIVAASERNQERARRAANARHHGKPKQSSTDATSNAQSNDLARLEECDPKAKSQKPKGESISNDTLSPDAGVSAAAAPKEGERFADFFNAYPRKDGMLDAEDAWSAAVADGAKPADIIAGMHRQIRRWTEDGTLTREKGRFLPSAVSWLTGRRWLDPIDTAVAGNPTSPTWPGPEAIADAVAIELRERGLREDDAANFCRSYLHPAGWSAPSTIIARTNFAAEKLRGINRLKSYTIRVEEARAA
jgi:uncharacterized protein YdaU (DUF1376 family)